MLSEGANNDHEPSVREAVRAARDSDRVKTIIKFIRDVTTGEKTEIEIAELLQDE